MEEKTLEEELIEAAIELKRMRLGADLMPEGMTSSETQALLGIDVMRKHLGTARSSVIASTLCITKSAFSQTLRGLESKGLVRKTRSGEDSRVMELEVTDAGRDMLLKIDDLKNRYIEGLMDYVGREDLERCLHVMRKVSEYQRSFGFENCDEWDGDGRCA